jgi:hypothetical protein
MKRAIVGVLACALALAFGACAWMGFGSRRGPIWASATVVRVEASGEFSAGNLSLGYMRWMTKPAEGNPAALLMRDGDLLFVKVEAKEKGADKEREYMFPWRAGDGANLSVRMDGPLLILGDHAVALDLASDADGWDWAGRASESELAGLRCVNVEKQFAGEQAAVFERIAGVNPHVGLVLQDAALLARVPALDPRWLLIDNAITQPELDALPKRKAIESLIIQHPGENLNLQRLAALPNLRRLMLYDYDSAKTAMPALPRLESLTFVHSTLQDLIALRPLAGLRELDFTLTETNSLNGIEALSQLQELGVAGAKENETLNCVPLDSLKELRWVSFGAAVAPGQVARVMETHPKLQTVELLDCEEFTNLAPVASLRELEHLIFLPKRYEGSLEPIRQMKNLRLLVLPEALFKEKPADIADLRAALPGCVIAEGEPLCLGAGRILLLVPLVLLGWVCIARRRNRAA